MSNNNLGNSSFDGFNESNTGNDEHQQTPYLTPHSNAHNNDLNEVDLNKDAPELAAGAERRINKNAVFFLCLIGLFGFLGAAWAFKYFFSKSEVKPPADEVVTVPNVPSPTIINAAASTTPSTPLSTAVEPIPVIEKTKQPALSGLPPPPSYSTSLPPSIPVDSLVERRKADPSFLKTAVNHSDSNSSFYEDEFKSVKQGAAQRIPNKDNRLVRGTYIRCVLETKMVSDVPGFASCVVTEPVYSFTGKSLLLPKGTKVSGQYKTSSIDVPRIEVVWNRALTPNGLDVRLDSNGTDNLGASGQPGDYRTHWGARLGSALLISIVSDAFKVAASKFAPTNTVVTNTSSVENPFDSNTAETLQKAASQALARSANRPATVTINQGTLINIYIARDIDFSSLMDN